MDEKPDGPKAPDIEIGVETLPVHRGVTDRPPRPRKRRARGGAILGGVAVVLALAGLATGAFIYTEMQREVLRISTEIAQLRLSLDLYAQRGGAAPATGTSTPADTSAIKDLQNRLAILEASWRSGAAVQPRGVPAVSAPTASSQSDGDCLPAGTRLLVAAGDSYPVCGTDAVVEVMNVSDGYISLMDGTTVPSGGTAPLSGTACLIAVTSGGDEAVTGYAEIRVTC